MLKFYFITDVHCALKKKHFYLNFNAMQLATQWQTL